MPPVLTLPDYDYSFQPSFVFAMHSGITDSTEDKPGSKRKSNCCWTWKTVFKSASNQTADQKQHGLGVNVVNRCQLVMCFLQLDNSLQKELVPMLAVLQHKELCVESVSRIFTAPARNKPGFVVSVVLQILIQKEDVLSEFIKTHISMMQYFFYSFCRDARIKTHCLFLCFFFFSPLLVYHHVFLLC